MGNQPFRPNRNPPAATTTAATAPASGTPAAMRLTAPGASRPASPAPTSRTAPAAEAVVGHVAVAVPVHVADSVAAGTVPVGPFAAPASPHAVLSHERLDAYRVARDLLAFVAERRSRLRGLPGDLADHIERSSVSVLLNIAEAAGRSSPKDRRNRFAIARGETCEVAAALDAARLFGAIAATELAAARALLVRLAQMLTRLAA